jgi:uncharacterized protein YndB with AHSA1/START domain
MTGLHYRQTVFILAKKEKVWDALVNPDITPKYMFGCAVISEWIPGSPVLWRSVTNGVDYVKGRLIEFEPPMKLSFTVFDPNAGYVDDPVNYLTTAYQLFEEENGTRLEVSQGDFSMVENGEKRYKEGVLGWEMTLQSFKRLLED